MVRAPLCERKWCMHPSVDAPVCVLLGTARMTLPDPEPVTGALPSPQPAATGTGRRSETALRARSAHRVLVPVLLVLATVIGIAATFAVWVNRQALNTNNWSSTSSQILQDKKVQTALSAYLVHELFTNVNVSADLQTILPKPLQPLAGPAAAGLQQLAGQVAPKVLASPQVQAAWVQANIAAHKQLLKVLNGGGAVVSTKSGVVTLNLQALVSQLAATLGVSSQVAAVKQKLGITVPPSAGQLVIMRSDQLKSAQDIANAVKSLAIVLPAIALLLFALAVYLARGRRRRTLRTTGWCFVMIGIALLLIRRIAGDAVVDGLVKVASNKPAVHDVWSIATSLLYDIGVAMIVYGLVIVAAAWLAGGTRPATAIRKAMAPSLRDSPAVAYLVVGAALALVMLWGPTPALRNVWWILVFAVLLALGVAMLRRETAIESPGIEPGQALRDFREQRAQAGARSVAAPEGRVESLERLAALRDRGAISDDEYEAEKTRIINSGTSDRVGRS